MRRCTISSAAVKIAAASVVLDCPHDEGSGATDKEFVGDTDGSTNDGSRPLGIMDGVSLPLVVVGVMLGDITTTGDSTTTEGI